MGSHDAWQAAGMKMAAVLLLSLVDKIAIYTRYCAGVIKLPVLRCTLLYVIDLACWLVYQVMQGNYTLECHQPFFFSTNQVELSTFL